MGWLRRNFLTGLLILLPTVITIFVFYRIFIAIDNILKPLVAKYPILDFPGLGFIGVILIILLTGMFGRNLIGRRIIAGFESIGTKIPLFSRIYIAIKQISEVFLQQERTVFREAILVQYPRPGIYSIAFVTSRCRMPTIDGKVRTFINIFLPTTPNPTSGFFLMIPEREAIPLECTIEEALKMVISAGAVMSPLYSLGSTEQLENAKGTGKES